MKKKRIDLEVFEIVDICKISKCSSCCIKYCPCCLAEDVIDCFDEEWLNEEIEVPE